jgi:hypothetical protein
MRVTDLVFTQLPKRRSANTDLLTVSPENELRGVTIPLHPGASGRAR